MSLFQGIDYNIQVSRMSTLISECPYLKLSGHLQPLQLPQKEVLYQTITWTANQEEKKEACSNTGLGYGR